MSRIRTIKPQFFLNDELASLNPLDRILFIGLWTIADREGRLEDRPAKTKAAILPYDDYDVEEALKRLTERGFIERYSVEGERKRFIEITNFRKHQCPNTKEPPSAIPAPCRNSAGTLQGAAPALCQDNSGTPRLGKGKEGKGEKESCPPQAPLPVIRPGASEKAANSGKPVLQNGRDQPARAGPMPAGGRGKYDGIAENI